MSEKSNPGKTTTAAAASTTTLSSLRTYGSWDPTLSRDWTCRTPPYSCLMRIKRDIMALYKEPIQGIFISPDETDVTLIHALVTGPADTPYHGGFFYFLVRFPPDYPISAPRVKLMTTGGGRVQFNPHLYSNGKVCLSIIGTFLGPSWSPVQTISTVLLSIQSLLNENPYHDEPGFENRASSDQSTRYNDVVTHETLRVAVCDMLEGNSRDTKNCPKALCDKMERSFLELYEHYEALARKNAGRTYEPMSVPFHESSRIPFDYAKILQRLQAIKKRLDEKPELKVGTGDSLSEEDYSRYEKKRDEMPLEELLCEDTDSDQSEDEEMSESED